VSCMVVFSVESSSCDGAFSLTRGNEVMDKWIEKRKREIYGRWRVEGGGHRFLLWAPACGRKGGSD
jgi:hypothetical protein